MFVELKKFLVDTFKMDESFDEDATKKFAADKVKSGELELDKYMELISAKSATPIDDIVAKITAQVTENLKGSIQKPKEEPTASRDIVKELEELESRILKKAEDMLGTQNAGDDGAKLMEMGREEFEKSPVNIRVKGVLEGFRDNKTALTYSASHDRVLKRYGQPIVFNGKELNAPTDRTKYMCGIWAKFQLYPESMSEREMEVVQHILHNEKFHTPSSNPYDTEAKFLSANQRVEVLNAYKNFYSRGGRKVALLDDSTSGGEYSVPEFFDYDMIIAPTLASENISALCNVVPVARGSSAQNFVLGIPTVTSEPEGVAADVFDATSFIANHDTPFFRAAGFLEIGLNYESDSHPRLVMELYNQYRNAAALWLHEQITTGDGATEPLGILNTPSVTDIPASAGTAGNVGLTDVLNLLFGVSKAYRSNGAANRAVYIMTETLYKRIRSIATGVTGDDRLLFGMNVEDYQLFGHPVKLEERGLTNSQVIFAQMSGYRLYLRQGLRLIRERGGRTLTLNNTELLGVDLRVGGQLDLPGYAAIIDDLAV